MSLRGWITATLVIKPNKVEFPTITIFSLYTNFILKGNIRTVLPVVGKRSSSAVLHKEKLNFRVAYEWRIVWEFSLPCFHPKSGECAVPQTECRLLKKT